MCFSILNHIKLYLNKFKLKHFTKTLHNFQVFISNPLAYTHKDLWCVKRYIHSVSYLNWIVCIWIWIIGYVQYLPTDLSSTELYRSWKIYYRSRTLSPGRHFSVLFILNWNESFCHTCRSNTCHNFYCFTEVWHHHAL